MSDALNPNHPVTMAMEDQWHKIVSLLLHKLRLSDVVITVADIESFRNNPQAITIQELEGGIHLNLVSMEEAERLAKREGGLPA